jgi:hypothetical protein
VKWAKVCGIVPSLPAGGTTNVVLTDAGSGNFGGTDLAVDGGATITVSTGAAVFGRISGERDMRNGARAVALHYRVFLGQ